MIAIIVLWILLGIIAVIVILLHFSISVYIKADGGGIAIKAKYLFLTLYPRNEKPKKARPSRRRGRRRSRAEDKKELEASVPEAEDPIDIGSEDSHEESKPEYIAESMGETSVTKAVEEYSEEAEHETSEDTADDSEEDREAEEQSENMDGSEKQSKKSDSNKRKDRREKSKKKDSKKEKKSSSKQGGKLDPLKSKYNKIKPYIPTTWKAVKKLLKTIRIEDLRTEVNVGRFDAHEAVIYYGAVQGAMFNTLALLAGIFTVKIKKAKVNCIFTQNTVSGELETYVRVRPSAVIALAVCTAVNFLIIYLREKKKRKKPAECIQPEEEINRAADAA